MILWGRASSVNVQKVLWALDEFGVVHDHRTVGGKYGGTDAPSFTALTPVRRVPVLEDVDIVVWESNAILRHLARRFPDHPLGQSYHELAVAARIDSLLDLGTSTLQPPFIGLFWQLVRMTDSERDATQVKAHRAALAGGLVVLEAILGDGRSYLAGDQFSIADIGVGTIMFRLLDVAPHLTEDMLAVTAWHSRLAQRPAFESNVAVSYDELRPN